MSDTRTRKYDVIVTGGGPGGATAAALLAESGRRVLVLEKEAFPRSHVGESLLPYAYFPLKRIGLLEKMKGSDFPRKHSVQFVSQTGKVAAPFYFFNHTDHELATTWQVSRAEFDQMLLDNARQKGAEVQQRTRVTDLLYDAHQVVGVEAVRHDGETFQAHALVTIDATGRNALSMTRNGWRKDDPMLNRVACWTYYRGAMRDPGLDAGSTTVAYLPEKCWFWYIPLANDVVSVGIVGEKDDLFAETRDLGKVFARHIPRNPWIQRHVATGTQFGKFFGTRDFSYRSEYCAQDGLLLVGDAFAFLDPVFSSGLYFALRGGELAGDAVNAALDARDVTAARFHDYGDRMTGAIEAMRKLVYAFYDRAFSFGKLIRKYPDVRMDLTDCLIGNLEKDFTALFAAASEFADLPEPLAYGGPRTSEQGTAAPRQDNEP